MWVLADIDRGLYLSNKLQFTANLDLVLRFDSEAEADDWYENHPGKPRTPVIPVQLSEEFERVTVSGHEFPPTGSLWRNNHTQTVYEVVGVVVDSETDEEQVLYKPCNAKLVYWRRSVESWYGTNRNGDPRFVRLK